MLAGVTMCDGVSLIGASWSCSWKTGEPRAGGPDSPGGTRKRVRWGSGPFGTIGYLLGGSSSRTIHCSLIPHNLRVLC